MQESETRPAGVRYSIRSNQHGSTSRQKNLLREARGDRRADRLPEPHALAGGGVRRVHARAGRAEPDDRGVPGLPDPVRPEHDPHGDHRGGLDPGRPVLGQGRQGDDAEALSPDAAVCGVTLDPLFRSLRAGSGDSHDALYGGCGAHRDREQLPSDRRLVLPHHGNLPVLRSRSRRWSSGW